MAKKKPVKATKAAKKPASSPKKKAVKAKPAAKKAKVAPVKAAKKAARPVAKPVKPIKKVVKAAKQVVRPAAKSAATRKPARPAIKPVIKGKQPLVKKAVPARVPAKGAVKPAVKPEPVKGKPAPAPLKEAPVPVKNTNAAPAPKAKKVVAPPPPPIPSNLPKLPKGIILKKQKGKLAPGEKRIVKTDIITHHVIADRPLEELDKKPKPEPKGKFVLEYIIHSPVTLLYDFLTTPNGLAEWFADGVDMKNDIYTFDWDGQKQNARIISAKIDSYIRLRWMDKPEGSYFEFRLNQDELTNEVSLTVTDFGESEDDIITSRRLWDSQIHRLVKALGTY